MGIKVNIISSVTNRGKVRFMLSEKAFNTQLFKEFMKRLIRDAGGKVFLIVDNLSVRHAKCNQTWLEKNKESIELFYLPSHSPDLKFHSAGDHKFGFRSTTGTLIPAAPDLLRPTSPLEHARHSYQNALTAGGAGVCAGYLADIGLHCSFVGSVDSSYFQNVAGVPAVPVR